MSILLNIIYYFFAIGIPLYIILVAVFKKSERKFFNILEKTIIAVIIFGIFYIFKLGVNTYLLEGENSMSTITDNKSSNNKLSDENQTNITDEKELENKNNDSENQFELTQVDGVTYVEGVLIVNKTYPLPKDYVPTNTYKDATSLSYCAECLDKDAYQKYKEMDADATSLGLNIWIQSGYRSYGLQETLYNNYVKKDGKLAADTYSARPGHSEHQTGLAFDLNTINDAFQYTDEGKWINENAYLYGFILRYPKGKEEITGYKYESWHLRYVGEELAKTLYNNGDWITLEEYFNLTSEYEEN